MENKEITAAQISASSQYDGSHAPNQGRLHFKGGQGAWAAGANNPNQWFQIELRVEANVTFVATQARYANLYQRVTRYKLQYSKDGLSFQIYKQSGEQSDKVRVKMTFMRSEFPVEESNSQLRKRRYKKTMFIHSFPFTLQGGSPTPATPGRGTKYLCALYLETSLLYRLHRCI